MLQSKQLDSESFDDIIKNAVNSISKIYPEWTDYNSSDSGIMLLELMSWFKEIQQYHLSVITDEHYRRWFKLLGCYPRGIKAAGTYLKINGNGIVPKGSVFSADDITFETQGDFFAADSNICKLESANSTVENLDTLADDGEMEFQLFGKGVERYFTLYTSSPLPCNEKLNIYFSIKQEHYHLDDSDDFDGFVSFHAEYWDNSEWQHAELILDETKGFMKSGVITLRLNGHSQNSLKDGIYPLRFVIDSGEYPTPPITSRVTLNVVNAHQCCTYSTIYKADKKDIKYSEIGSYDFYELYGVDGERRVPLGKPTIAHDRLSIVDNNYNEYELVAYRSEFVGRRNLGRAFGLCEFSVEFDIADVIAESIRLYISESDGSYLEWKRVDNFDSSDKYSKHFVYNNGKITFGNGEHGMPPNGELLLVSCSTSRGKSGNVKCGTVNSYNKKVGAYGTNITDAAGGMDAETTDECRRRVKDEAFVSKTCVTREDCEAAAKATPAVPIKRIKVFTGEAGQNEVIIAAETYGGNGLNAGCANLIRKTIAPRMPIGTKLTIVPPVYAAINIYADVEIIPGCNESKAEIKKVLEEYFDDSSMGFGCIISQSGINRYIMNRCHISTVNEIDISVSGSNAEVLNNGDIALRDNCLPKIDRITVVTSLSDK